MSSGRTRTDAVTSEVDGNKKKFEWEIFDPKNELNLKIIGCNNGDHYIAKEYKHDSLIIRPFKRSSNHNANISESTREIEILRKADPNHTPCWKPVTLDGNIPVGAFRVIDGRKNIYVGKHLDKGVGQVKRLNGEWTYVSEDDTKIGSDFEILC